jgi:hypothetical protein
VLEPDERVAGQRSARQLALDALFKKYCRGAKARGGGGAEAELLQQAHLAELRASLMEERLKVGAAGRCSPGPARPGPGLRLAACALPRRFVPLQPSRRLTCRRGCIRHMAHGRMQVEQSASAEAGKRKLLENSQLLAEVAELRRSHRGQQEEIAGLRRQAQQAQERLRAAAGGNGAAAAGEQRLASAGGSRGDGLLAQPWPEGRGQAGAAGQLQQGRGAAHVAGGRCAGSAPSPRLLAGVGASSSSARSSSSSSSSSSGAGPMHVGRLTPSSALATQPQRLAAAAGTTARPSAAASAGRPLSATATAAAAKRCSSAGAAGFAAAGKPAGAAGGRPSTAAAAAGTSLLGAAAAGSSSAAGAGTKRAGGRSLQAMMLDELSSWRQA